MSVHIRRFRLQTEWVRALSLHLQQRLRAAIREREQALVALSGGRTPKPVYQHLSRQPLDWPSVTVTLADERWVGPDSDASNERLVRESLLRGRAAHACFVPLYRAAPTAAEGQAACERALAGLPLPFDVVVLGMGDDGHTASLFPGSAALARALAPAAGEAAPRCVAMEAPSPPTQRMSLTLHALLSSREIVLMLQGESKWRVFQEASAGTDAMAMPVRAVLNQDKVPVHVFWSE